MSLRAAHEILGWLLVVGNGIAGVWALIAHRFPVARGRALWIFTGIAQTLIALQVIVGVIDMQRRDLEIDGVHLFYGFVALFTVGIIYSYRHQLVTWQYLLYGFGGLFLMGLALRSMFIAPLAS